MKKIILFCAALGVVACNRHIDTNSIHAENRRVNNNKSEAQ